MKRGIREIEEAPLLVKKKKILSSEFDEIVKAKSSHDWVNQEVCMYVSTMGYEFRH